MSSKGDDLPDEDFEALNREEDTEPAVSDQDDAESLETQEADEVWARASFALTCARSLTDRRLFVSITKAPCCAAQEAPPEVAEIAAKERERLRLQNQLKKEQLDKLRQQQNVHASDGEVLPAAPHFQNVAVV
jgi:hypothetical protein